MVKSSPLSIFDPIFTATNVTADHGIYDTLFSFDSNFKSQPQMVDRWSVSDDQRTYTFELRDGLGWHDGTPVTAADCVASIRRWGEAAPAGQLILALANDISKKDEKTFTVSLKEPLGILVDLLADLTPPCLFIMREKDTHIPASEQVTTKIGSGPFVFNEKLARPGASFTYDRNEKYIPRREMSSGLAGGKIVKVDRVIWDNITDQQTAFAALQAGEIDYVETPPADLYSLVESDPNLELQVLDAAGWDGVLRMNCLQPPFNNVKARQALLHLIDQEAFMRVMAPDPKYTSTLVSIFGSVSPYSNDENTSWFKKGGNPEKAKQLFRESGYAGEKVLILDPTDWHEGDSASQLLAATLQKIGINAQLEPMDWGALSTRRANKGPIENGGWNIFITTEMDYSLGNPLTDPLQTANGDKAWYGWPQNEDYEALRAKWANIQTVDERKALARKMQGIWWDFVGDIRFGRYISPVARRRTLTGLIGVPAVVPMWNMQKSSA
ncbi:ABC transporter substrate-binding protein [Sinorhizobium meliloti]|uniref:ABC transporter substrate-binding protein n=1 Tax=Rhizobium meliloti TaxID=382 RepID=UPI002091D663|nr:ABC transporter substrate-binding protein [Sinorhizobium meliloti]MCO5966019.1 ABC transporter substrate-binding protein [Sinorhizobium meliloti]